MRINGFICDGCGAITDGDSGDQRDPGPFLPKNWWGGVAHNGGPHFCPDCSTKIHDGALRAAKGGPS